MEQFCTYNVVYFPLFKKFGTCDENFAIVNYNLNGLIKDWTQGYLITQNSSSLHDDIIKHLLSRKCIYIYCMITHTTKNCRSL